MEFIILNIFEPPKSNFGFFANITRTVKDSETQFLPWIGYYSLDQFDFLFSKFESFEPFNGHFKNSKIQFLRGCVGG